MDKKKRIAEIDKEIKKLKAEKKVLSLEVMKDNQKSKPIINRLTAISNMDTFRRPSSIEQPLFKYSILFAEKLGKPLQSCVFDDYFCRWAERHEIVSIADVCDDFWGRLPKGDLPESNPNFMVKVIYDRSTKTYFEAPIMEVLQELERWALENEISGWEIDW